MKTRIKRLKDYSMTNLLATLSAIKCEEVINTEANYTYSNHKLPTLKYYNITNNLQVFTIGDIIKGFNNLTIVGTAVVSKTVTSCGTQNAWGGKLMVVSLDSAIEYIKNFNIEHSTSMTFYDNAYPTPDALEKIEIEAERVFKKLTSTYKRKFGIPEKIVKAKSLSEIDYKIGNYDIKTDDKLPTLLQYTMSDVDTNNKQVISACVFGGDTLETKDTVELMIKHIKKTFKADVVGMNRQNKDGQDWNSRIWSSNGLFKVYFVKQTA